MFRTRSAMAGRSGWVPMRLEAAVTAEPGAVREQCAHRPGGELPVAGSKSAQRTVAPARSAACTHGRMFASWSRRVTTTSSPGDQLRDSVRDIS